MWSGLLGIPESAISPTKNFFDLGGHSLLLIRLLSQIRKEFGVSIPFTAIYNGGTIQAFGELISKASANARSATECLVEIKSTGRKKPIVMIHPISGTVFCYQELAALLDHPVIAIQADLEQAAKLKDPTFESMAKHYLEALSKKFNPGGYYLGGWSMGGMIAYEMAQQLRAGGKSIPEPLILIDSFIPSVLKVKNRAISVNYWLVKDLEEKFGIKTGVTEESCKSESYDETLHRITSGIESSGLGTAKEIGHLVKNIFSFYKSSLVAIERYDIKPYPNQIVLFRAGDSYDGAERPEKNGWDTVAANLTCVPISGNHFTMLKGTNVKSVAEQIERLWKA
jgi:thioesterase domain-containing protein/acyl carrier protein